jgi:glycosyltransferase involved in cell wall biosynthesis
MSKTILMIAFDFPPSNAASVQRTLKFFEYLNEFGWTTIMLTAKPHAYPLIDENFNVELKPNQFVYRANALDVHQHLSIKGKHFNWMKTPDRWGSWVPFALLLGKSIIKKHQPDIIWSTYPTPSANIIASQLAKYCNKPWIADYRDPAPYIHTSNGKWLDKVHKKIDEMSFKQAAHLCFATRESKDLYQQQYPDKNNFTVIENGYDEQNFVNAEALALTHPNIFNQHKFSLYYAGGLYPNGRDPVPIFEAIAALKQQNKINENNFELIFQGAGNGNEFAGSLTALNIQQLVSFIEPTSFLLALVNMFRADALLLIQDTRFNLQIPGKIFEYFRTGKPLLIKTDPQGATAELAKTCTQSMLCYLTPEIEQAIEALITYQFDTNKDETIQHHDRKIKASILNGLINDKLNSNRLD